MPVPLAALCGLAWLALGPVRAADPMYWDPVTALDYAAVGLFSVATIVLGASIWAFGRDADRAIRWSATVVGIAGIAVGVANFLEDWLLMRPFGVLFIVGTLTVSIGLVALTIALAMRAHTRIAALVPLLTLIGLFASGGSGVRSLAGCGLIGVTWLIVAALGARKRSMVEAAVI